MRIANRAINDNMVKALDNAGEWGAAAKVCLPAVYASWDQWQSKE
jgi:hypothetical protein